MEIVRKFHNLFHPVLGQVLMLHRVVEHLGPQPEALRLEVTLDYLVNYLDALRAKGADFIGIDQVAERLKSKDRSRFVCVTFDDGYLDTYTLAYPVLKERQIPFCVYMTRAFYRGEAKPHWNPAVEMMNVEQLVALSKDPLCTIGAHTCSHPHLRQCTVAGQWHEMEDGKDDLERIIGKSVRHFAYPYGDYNQETLRIALEIGFRTAVTTSGRPVRSDAQLLELDRVTFGGQ